MQPTNYTPNTSQNNLFICLLNQEVGGWNQEVRGSNHNQGRNFKRSASQALSSQLSYISSTHVGRKMRLAIRSGNEYPLQCYYLGHKIAKGYPWRCDHNVYIPDGALYSWAHRGVMQGKLTEGEPTNHARDERQPQRESLTLVLLRSRPRAARFSTLPPPVCIHKIAFHVKYSTC